jgi:hypothetical protein
VNAQNRAWMALALNLAVLPGLGTLFLRRYLAGLVQLALAASGFAATLAWMLAFVREWSRRGAFPLDRGPLFPYALAGLVAFLAAWTWCARSGWELARAARRTGGE